MCVMSEEGVMLGRFYMMSETCSVVSGEGVSGVVSEEGMLCDARKVYV